MRASIARNKPQEETNSTAEFLLDTAEKLFAEKGIENVSLRQIVMASGHGNLSGAHYHFGSRDVLILQLLDRRMRIVNNMRNAMLDKVVADGFAGDLKHLVGQAIKHLAAVVTDYPWGRDYVLITAQALFISRLQLEVAIGNEVLSGNIRLKQMVRTLLGHVDAREFEQRYQMFQHESVYTFARWLQVNGSVTQTNRLSFEAMTVVVVSFMLGGLLAPET